MKAHCELDPIALNIESWMGSVGSWREGAHRLQVAPEKKCVLAGSIFLVEIVVVDRRKSVESKLREIPQYAINRRDRLKPWLNDGLLLGKIKERNRLHALSPKGFRKVGLGYD